MAGWFPDSLNLKKANSLYSVLTFGAGIFGLGNNKPVGMLWWKRDGWSVSDPNDVNG
jgi:hypothetical protein